MKFLLLAVIIVILGGGAIFLFFSQDVQEEPDTPSSLKAELLAEKIQETPSSIILNQGNDMEGHTPRGFKGMGTGLFVGDNLNSNFPNGDGVQTFLTFDLQQITNSQIESAVLRSSNIHTNGSPFEDLGNLRAEEVRYENFSSELWNLKAEDFNCVFANSANGPFSCNVTEAVQQSLNDRYAYAQFRLLFDKAGDSDNEQDLAMFFITNSNTNEPGIFELEITNSKQ